MKKYLYFCLILFITITLLACANKLEIYGENKVSINETIILSHNYDGDKTIIWESSDENIATVDEGIVTGVSIGEVIIYLTVGNEKIEKTITVTNPIIDIIIESKSTLIVGEKYRFFANIPEKYQNLDVGIWKSGDEQLITIDENGVSYPIEEGSTYILYEYLGNIVQTNITIVYNEASSVALEGVDTVGVNDEITLQTIFTPNNTKSECIYSSSNEEIATVDQYGTVRGLKEGEVVITVSFKNNPNIKSSKKIKVILMPNSISFDTNEKTIVSKIGQLNNLNLIINNSEYTTDYKKLLNINVSDNRILLTDGQYYLGLKEGEVTITIESIFNKEINASINIKIEKNELNDEFSEQDYKLVNELLSNMTLEQKIGQMFMVGFSGTSFNSTLESAIENYHFGNIIYMGANVSNPNSIQKMSNDIQQCLLTNNSVYGFISTDQEGGRVARIKNGGTHFVSNMAIASTNDFIYGYKQGQAMGKELLYYGINMDLAPVLDVNNNHENPVIGVRSYSDNPLLVSEYGKNVITGLQENGVIACPKHFPGHGNTNVDSHYGLPVINSDIDTLYQVELVPFINAINNGMDCIMTTHIIFSAIDTKYPATLSEKVLTGLLRNDLGYDGLIATDGMEMNAVAKYFGDYDETAVLAVKAGVDLLLYTSLNNPTKAYNGLLNAVKNGELTEERINESVRRILLTKLKYNTLNKNNNVSYDIDTVLKQNADLSLEIACKSITVAKGQYKQFDKQLNTLIIAPSSTKLNTSLKPLLINNGYKTCDFLPLDNETDYNNIINVLSQYDQIIYANSNLKVNNNYYSKIINDIYNVNKNSIVIALDSPYDYLQYDGDKINTYICLYGNQDVSINALSKLLLNEYIPTGNLPIDKDLFK